MIKDIISYSNLTDLTPRHTLYIIMKVEEKTIVTVEKNKREKFELN